MSASPKPTPHEPERFQTFRSDPLHWVEQFILRRRRVLAITYLIFLLLVGNSLKKPQTSWYNVMVIVYVVYLFVLEIWSRVAEYYHTTLWRAVRTQIHLVMATLLFAFAGATPESYLVYLPWVVSAAIFFKPVTGLLMTVEAAVLASVAFWRYGQVPAEEFWLRGTLLATGLIGANLLTVYLWQRWTTEQQARDRQINTLREVGNAITTAIGLDKTFEAILDLTRQLILFETALILSWDSRNQVLSPKAHRGYDPDFLRSRGFAFRLDQGLTGHVALTRKALLVPDVVKDAPVLPKYPEISDGKILRSFLAVPLTFGGDLLGVFELTSDQPHAFNEEHKEILSWLADQISIAMRNARLQERLSEELMQTSALHRLSVVAHSRLDMLDDLLRLILDTALQLTNCSQGWISLVENGDTKLKVQAVSGVPETQRHVLEIGRGIMGWVAKTGRSLCVADVRVPIHMDDADVQPVYHEFIPGTRSELCVPLKVDSQILGILNIESPRVGAFDDTDRVLLERLATQASISIHRARLLQETDFQLEELRNLYEISLAMADQEFDVEALLRTIVERAANLLKVHGGGGLLSYPSEREVRMAFTHNLDAMRDFTCKFGEGMVGRVVESGKALIVNDYQRWEHKIVGLGEEPYCDLIKAVVQVPLKWQEQVIGVLFVSDNSSDKTFNERDLRLLERFANLAALTIGNAREHSYLQKLVSSSPDAIIAVDRKGTVIRFNEASERILGLEKEEVIGRHVALYYYDEEREARKINSMLIDAGGQGVKDYETYARGKDGEKIPIRFSGMVLHDEAGRRIGSIGIITDLRKEKALEDSQRKSEFLAELEHYPQDEPTLSLPDLRKRLTGQLGKARAFCQSKYLILFASVNENETVLPAIAWTGLPSQVENNLPHFNWRKSGLQPKEGSREEILRCEADVIEGWTPKEELREMMLTGIRGGEKEFFADAAHLVPLRLADNYRSVLVFGPLTAEAGMMNEADFLKNVNHTIGTSALSWLQALYLRAKQEEAETSARLIVHRARVKLLQINGKFGIIKRFADVQSPICQAAGEGEELVKYLSTSVTRALTSAVIDLEPEDYDFQLYPLAALVQNCVESFREQAKQENRGLRIDPTVENLPYAEVDPTILLIALGNLIDNALKYSFEQTYVQVRSEHDTQKARIIVEDLGEQLPETARANLREPGRRWAVSARARRIPGMGLGLWEASVIAGVHGGTVDFASIPRPRRGRTAHHARVWIEIPLERS